jgi:hypothetical protein
LKIKEVALYGHRVIFRIVDPYNDIIITFSFRYMTLTMYMDVNSYDDSESMKEKTKIHGKLSSESLEKAVQKICLC